ncbi:MAG TPA: glycosyltransferase family 39 protein [Thermoanaerobaculia bacterium]|nr:glycosyltransferase family 39 protein [Thermoanaerobaculia bacterium]
MTVPDDGTSKAGARHGMWAAIFAISLIAGVVLRLSEWIGAGLWLDEYQTLLAAGAPSLRDVLALASVEAHPPLYWLLLHVVMRSVGSDPLVAKGLSLVFGIAALLVTAVVARRRWGVPAGIVAAVVLGGSAVAVHYSTEARPYALVAFALHLGLLSSVAAVERPAVGTYLAQGAALLFALSLNFFALTLLPVGPALALFRRRGRLLLHQILISTVVFLVTSPPLVRVATRIPPEANEYLQTFWAGRHPAEVLAAVGWDLMPSSRWPPAHGPGAKRTPLDPVLEGASLAGVLLVLAGGAAASLRSRRSAQGGMVETACITVLASAVAMAVFSILVGRPVVTPGRFAASFVPAVALLAGAATMWSRSGLVGSVLLATVAAASTGASFLKREAGIAVDRGELTAKIVASGPPGPFLVVSVGLSGTPVRYYLRQRPDVTYASFPPDVDDHIGWWAPAKALGEPAALARDAERVARRAVDASREGQVVLLIGADHPVASPLRAALSRTFELRPLHGLVRGAFVLQPRTEPSSRGDPKGALPAKPLSAGSSSASGP